MATAGSLPQTPDPFGTPVVVDRRLWHRVVIANHPELAGELEGVLAAISRPARVEADPLFPQRRRFLAPHPDGEAWLAAVVAYEAQPPALVTAGLLSGTQPPTLFGDFPALWFEEATGSYDPSGDVLYLHHGDPAPARGLRTTEGHLLRLTPDGAEVVGLTVIGARAILASGPGFTLTVPKRLNLEQAQLERFLVGG